MYLYLIVSKYVHKQFSTKDELYVVESWKVFNF